MKFVGEIRNSDIGRTSSSRASRVGKREYGEELGLYRGRIGAWIGNSRENWDSVWVPGRSPARCRNEEGEGAARWVPHGSERRGGTRLSAAERREGRERALPVQNASWAAGHWAATWPLRDAGEETELGWLLQRLAWAEGEEGRRGAGLRARSRELSPFFRFFYFLSFKSHFKSLFKISFEIILKFTQSHTVQKYK